MSRHFFLPALTLLALAGCSSGSGDGFSGPGPSGGAPSPATQIACRTRVNEMYDHRNRAEIYSANSSMNSPFSANYQSGVSSRGLASQFDYERTLRDCERNSGTAADLSGAIPVAPAATPSARGR